MKGAKFWVFVNIFCGLDLRFQSLLERDLDMVEAFKASLSLSLYIYIYLHTQHF